MKKLTALTSLIASTGLSIASAAPFLYENFSTGTDEAALLFSNTSDSNGSWQEFRDGSPNTTGAEGVYQSGTSHQFVDADNPFGVVRDVNARVLQQSSGRDSTLAFTPLAAGSSLYFSMNLNMIDAGGATAEHTITFYNGSANTPFVQLAVLGGGDSTFDLIAAAQNNTQTLTDAMAEDTAYFLYGKVDASADLTTWSISANITDDVSTIAATESWALSQSFVYGVARDSHANRISFDTGGTSPGRMLADEIRLGATYADVTAIPEPSSIALIGIALGALALFRRRK